MSSQIDCYFGIRPTGNKLHLGHLMTLFDMFDFIVTNINHVNNIYILLAEIHAQISKISIEKIKLNSKDLHIQILEVFNIFLRMRNISPEKIKYLNNKIKFIYQSDFETHVNITYTYLPLVNTNKVLKNPIFKNNNNNSVGFLIYPILQTFDIILYSPNSKDTDLYVFVGGDQRSNINISKDIFKKLNINNIIIKSYDHVLSDNKSVNKMSKSLDNFINYNDFNGILNYINKYITYPREHKTSIGNHNKCPFYTNFGKEISRLFQNQYLFEACDNGTISCKECKAKVSNIFINFNKLYKNYILTSSLSESTFNNLELLTKNYLEYYNKINNIRSSNENC
jgi:tryptophanyl-tRNA synthetase